MPLLCTSIKEKFSQFPIGRFSLGNITPPQWPPRSVRYPISERLSNPHQDIHPTTST
ncbi:hypothetical protein N431DRAFT_178228 [Stipitochalara longipes BDJ]|nr:hypothetical protein N431DRAFT_178228 [Stipitochalara longipes BDJ]